MLYGSWKFCVTTLLQTPHLVAFAKYSPQNSLCIMYNLQKFIWSNFQKFSRMKIPTICGEMYIYTSMSGRMSETWESCSMQSCNLTVASPHLERRRGERKGGREGRRERVERQACMILKSSKVLLTTKRNTYSSINHNLCSSCTISLSDVVCAGIRVWEDSRWMTASLSV